MVRTFSNFQLSWPTYETKYKSYLNHYYCPSLRHRPAWICFYWNNSSQSKFSFIFFLDGCQSLILCTTAVTFWTKPFSANPLDIVAEEGRQYTATNVTVTLDPDNPNATISVPIIDNIVRTYDRYPRFHPRTNDCIWKNDIYFKTKYLGCLVNLM